jgi:hypothetical protein
MDPVAVEKLLAVEVHLPLRRLLQGVDTADQGTLAGTRRADDSNLFPFPDMEINVFQGLKIPEGFTNPVQPDHGNSFIQKPV